MAATWDLRDECFEQPRGGFPLPTKSWYEQEGSASATAQSTSSSPSKKAHLWNAESIVRGFNITPAQYYKAENYLKALLFADNIHKINFKTKGYEMRYITSPVCENMIENFPWLSAKAVPYWFRIAALEGLIARVASDMRGENYTAAKKRKVTWSNRPAGALPKPKANDPYPLQFCSIKIVKSGNPSTQKIIKLTDFIGRNADRTLDLGDIQFERLTSPESLNVFNPKTHVLSYFVGNKVDPELRQEVKKAAQMKAALISLQSFLEPDQTEMVFYLDQISTRKSPRFNQSSSPSPHIEE